MHQFVVAGAVIGIGEIVDVVGDDEAVGVGVVLVRVKMIVGVIVVVCHL